MRVTGLQSKMYSSSHFSHNFCLVYRLNIYDVQQIDSPSFLRFLNLGPVHVISAHTHLRAFCPHPPQD